MTQESTADTAPLLQNAPEREEAISVEDTFWGYIVGPGPAIRNRARRAEAMAVFAALFFCGIAFVPWVTGGAERLANPDLIPFRIAITAIFFGIGGLMYLMAKKGMIPETQVDLHEREFRLVRRNRAQESVTLRTMQFSDVAQFKITRSPGNFLYGSLCLEFKGGKEQQVIATGPDRLLEQLVVRLNDDLRQESSTTKRPEAIATVPRRAKTRTAVFGGAVS